jgi:hypothetical protein
MEMNDRKQPCGKSPNGAKTNSQIAVRSREQQQSGHRSWKQDPSAQRRQTLCRQIAFSGNTYWARVVTDCSFFDAAEKCASRFPALLWEVRNLKWSFF